MILTVLAHIVVFLLAGAFIAGLVIDEDSRSAFLSIVFIVALLLGTYFSVTRVVSYWQERPSECTGNVCRIEKLEKLDPQ